MAIQGKKFTRGHRWLHWSIAGVMTVSYITGFLHEFWMSKHAMAAIIRERLHQVALSSEESVQVATSIRQPMWQWHVYAAYTMVALLFIRVVYMLLKGVRFPTPFKRQMPLHDRLEGMLYIFFYLFVFVLMLTGFYHLWGTDKAWRSLCGSIHKWAVSLFPAYVLLHIIGVLIAERTGKKGITSKMLAGD